MVVAWIWGRQAADVPGQVPWPMPRRPAPPLRRRLATAAVLAVRCCGCEGSAADGVVDGTPFASDGFQALPLKLHEPACRLGSQGNRTFVDLQPLDIEGIRPLGAAQLHAEYVAHGAVARGEGAPADLLLDARTADLWLPAPPGGRDDTRTEVYEHASNAGCSAVSSAGPQRGMWRLAGAGASADLRLTSGLRHEAQLPRQAFVAFETSQTPAGGTRAWSGVLGLGRLGAAMARRPFARSLAEASGKAVAWLSPGTGPHEAMLAVGLEAEEAICRTPARWASARGAPSAGEWTLGVEVAVGGEYTWKGAASLDLTGALLRVPEEQLAQVLTALLSRDGASRCFQPRPAGKGTAAGHILCPCGASAARPTLHVAVGSVDIPVPWSTLLQPVVDEADLCLLRVHAAPSGELPSIGAALLGSHALAFDFAEGKVGVCSPRDAAARISDRARARWSRGPQPVGADMGSRVIVASETQAAGVDMIRRGAAGELRRGEGGGGTTTAPPSSTPAAGTQESWLSSLGAGFIAFLVITISLAPAVSLSVYKKMQRHANDDYFSRRPAWKVDAGSDSAEDSDGLY